MGLNFTIDMTWGRLILLSLSKKRPKNQYQDTRGAGKWWLCTVHCGSSSILKVFFFWDTLYCYTSTNDKFKTSKCLITKSCSILRQWQFLVVTHLLLFVNASPLWFCNFLVYFQLDISRLSKHHVLLKSILRKIGYKLRSCLWAWTLYGGVGGQGNT